MKKYLMSFMTLIVFSFIFSLTANFSQVKAAECTTDKLIVHYLRFDGKYNNVGLFTWAGGNTGSADGLLPVESTDSYGGVVTVCIGDAGGQVKTEGDVTTYSVEIIPTTDVTETNGAWWASKDSYNGNNIRVDITELKKPDVAVQHVYIVEGTNTVLYPDTTKGVAVVVYFDATQDYKDWGIHTWNTGTNGSAPGWDTPIVFTANSYYKGVSTSEVKMAAINVTSDAQDQIGFIVHKGNDKKYGGDIMLDVADIKEGGVKVFYYIAGDANVVSAADFVANAFVFKFVPANITKKTGTFALSPEAIRVEFNQDITLVRDDVTVFNPAFFTLKEGDNVVPINVKYNPNATSARVFSIEFQDEYILDNTKTYTLYFDNQDTNEATHLVAQMDIDLDRNAPEITLVDGNEITITQGDEFTFPDYVATDDRDGIITKKVYVPSGKGALDTGILGEQEITLTVSDTWGNIAEQVFTVNVVAAPVENTLNLPLIIGASVGGVAVLGLAGFFLKKFSK